MGTNRRPKDRRKRNLSPGIEAHLSDRPTPEDDTAANKFLLQAAEWAELWEHHGARIVAEYAGKFPGKRPSFWWAYDAPKWKPQDRRHKGAFYDGVLPEPRKRLGGTGTPRHEVLAYAPHWTLGIPDCWVSQFDADYYNGRARDIHGNPIGTKYKEGHFRGVPIDPNDPPVYESQAAYLDRHGLFLEGERELLPADAFEPERVPHAN